MHAVSMNEYDLFDIHSILIVHCRLSINVAQRCRSFARFPPKDRARGKSASSWVVPAMKFL